tara:strand:- start:1311 stop:1721 length:411 start_codon:yes stop_codon:yes gene_type:complete
MKKFNKFITEKATDAGYPVDGPDFANDLANPKTIGRINSFLGTMGQIEYLVPEHALNTIRERLGRLSLSFAEVSLSEDGGVVSVPLTQFGGRFGEDDDGSAINDDGISHRVEGGLSLEITHEPTGQGTHFLRTKIV